MLLYSCTNDWLARKRFRNINIVETIVKLQLQVHFFGPWYKTQIIFLIHFVFWNVRRERIGVSIRRYTSSHSSCWRMHEYIHLNICYILSIQNLVISIPSGNAFCIFLYLFCISVDTIEIISYFSLHHSSSNSTILTVTYMTPVQWHTIYTREIITDKHSLSILLGL